MPIVFFLLWIVLNGRITLEIVLFDIAVTALIYTFLSKLSDTLSLWISGSPKISR